MGLSVQEETSPAARPGWRSSCCCWRAPRADARPQAGVDREAQGQQPRGMVEEEEEGGDEAEMASDSECGLEDCACAGRAVPGLGY